MKNKNLLIGVGLLAIIVIVVLIIQFDRERDEYLIGVITPQTGDAATYGVATVRGIDLAVDLINADNGINGRKIRVIYEDSKADPREAINAFNKLSRVDRVPVILGGFVSRVTLALAPSAQDEGVVLFSASSTADDIRYAGDFIFRNVPSNRNQGATAAKFVRDYLEAETAVILFQNDDYGRSLAEAFEEKAIEYGIRIILKDSFDRGQSDFRPVLTRIKNRNPDVVFFPGNYQECAIILRQSRELDLRSKFVGGDGAYSPELFRIAGAAAEDTYYTIMAMGFGVTDHLIEDFRNKFLERYNDEPDVYSSYAYDAMFMIAKAIELGGYDSQGIRDALHTIEHEGVTGITKFDEYGDVDKPFYLYVVRDGNFELLDWVP